MAHIIHTTVTGQNGLSFKQFLLYNNLSNFRLLSSGIQDWDIAVKFENEEDATVYVLKNLEEEFHKLMLSILDGDEDFENELKKKYGL